MQKVRIYILLLLGLAGITFLGLVLTVLLLEPKDWLSLLLFYSLLAALSFSIFTLSGVHLRKRLGQRELLNQYFAGSLRQGLWLTIILTGSLALASFQLFSWLNAGFLVLALVFLESYLITKNDRKS